LWRLILSSPRTPAAASGAELRARSPHQTGSSFSRHTRWEPGSQGALCGRRFIVLDTPAFQNNARLTQIAEEFAVKAFIAQLVVKLSICRFSQGFPGLM
jgi:hypothetical protein